MDGSVILAVVSSVVACLAMIVSHVAGRSTESGMVSRVSKQERELEEIRAQLERELEQIVHASELMTALPEPARRPTPEPRWVDDKGNIVRPALMRATVTSQRDAHQQANHDMVAGHFATHAFRRRQLTTMLMWRALLGQVVISFLPLFAPSTAGFVLWLVQSAVFVVAAILYAWWRWMVDPGEYGEEWACFIEDSHFPLNQEAFYTQYDDRHRARRERFLRTYGAALELSDEDLA